MRDLLLLVVFPQLRVLVLELPLLLLELDLSQLVSTTGRQLSIAKQRRNQGSEE